MNKKPNLDDLPDDPEMDTRFLAEIDAQWEKDKAALEALVAEPFVDLENIAPRTSTASTTPSAASSSPTGSASTGKTVPVTIRIKHTTRAALRREGKRRGVGYQTLLKEIIDQASVTW